MSDIGTNYRLEVEVLSPIHIGSGRPDLVDDLDYVRGRQIYVIDVERMLAELPADRLARAEEAAPLSSLLHAGEYARYARYALNDPTGGTQRVTHVRQHIKDAHSRPYIPGSSLKGAIRTALAWSLLRGTETQVQSRELGRNPRFADDPVEAQIFGRNKQGSRVDPNRDFLRAMHVVDSRSLPPAGNLELAQVVLHSLRDTAGGSELRSKGDRWSFFVEVLAAGAKLETSVRLDDYLLQPTIARSLGMGDKQDWVRGWLTYCNTFNQVVIAQEADFFAEHGLPRVKAFYDRLAHQAEATEAGRQCLLQISWGTGWTSKTVGTALNDTTLREIRRRYRLGRKGYPIFPKSRRLVQRGNVAEMPLGWVRLTLIDQAEEPFVPRVKMAPLPRRGEAPEPPVTKEGVPRRMKDLEPGMVLDGTVQGIANFGAFVDVGVGRNGLVHISELREGWVDNVRDVVQIDQRVRVRVLDVDLEHQRISLSMKGVPQP